MIYTTFFIRPLKHDKSESAVDGEPEGPVNPSTNRAYEETTGRRRMEFVSLADSKPVSRTPIFESRRRTTNPEHQARLQVIGTAREMLDAGTSEDRIRKLLPISEGELALLLTGRDHIETGDKYVNR